MLVAGGRATEFPHMTRGDSYPAGKTGIPLRRFRIARRGPVAVRDGERRGALTGSRRSISTLHLWQKNRDIGLPSTTASAMLYVSFSSPSLLAAVTVGSYSAVLGSHRLPSIGLGHGCEKRIRRWLSRLNSNDRVALSLAHRERHDWSIVRAM
jgi:hypothetical protein